MATKWVGAGSVVRLTIRGSLFNQTVMTSFDWQMDTAAVGTQDGAAASILFNSLVRLPGGVYAAYLAVMPDSWVPVANDWQWISPQRYRKDTFDTSGDAPTGGITTTPNLACAISFQGIGASRREQATKHLPGVGGADIDEGVLKPGYLLAVAGVISGAQVQMTRLGVTFFPSIYGRYIPADPTRVPPYPGQAEKVTPISAGFSNDKARTMRRRTVGLGI